LLVAACSREAPAPPTGAPAVAGGAELQIKDLIPGEGVEAVAGSHVTVHYTGWLYDPAQPEAKGRKFDSSRDAGQPFSFKLGARQVIAGWDQGVQGMKLGGQRELVIPAALAYGERGAGGVIPPGATLVFDVQLLAVEPPR
jgi:FKBP-type peptidyl-prolyl cis-trans isomerase FkpA